MNKKKLLQDSRSKGISWAKDFKAFILRGNVVEIAVGLTVGSAFTALVSSLVSDVIMPLISLLLRGQAFKDLFIALDGNYYESLAIAESSGAAVLKYGLFISRLVDFLIIALVIFVIVKVISRVQREEKK
jgi:large conductance mechanosensitive channel